MADSKDWGTVLLKEVLKETLLFPHTHTHTHKHTNTHTHTHTHTHTISVTEM